MIMLIIDLYVAFDIAVICIITIVISIIIIVVAPAQELCPGARRPEQVGHLGGPARQGPQGSREGAQALLQGLRRGSDGKVETAR